jgi:Zn-dependent metalloprotease
MQAFYKPFTVITLALLITTGTTVVAQKKSVGTEGVKSIARKPFFIKPGEVKSISGTYETSSYLKQLLKLSTNDEFRLSSAKTDQEGFTNQKHLQFHKGIKVEYGVVTTHFKNSSLESVGGEVYDIPEALGSTPSISERNALQVALDYTKAKKYKWENTAEEAYLKKSQGQSATYFPSGELVYVKAYLPEGGKAKDEMALAYKFDIYAEEPLSRNYIYVDAHTGAVIHVNAIIKHADGTAATRYSGTRTISTSLNTNGSAYLLRDITRSNGIETYNLNNGTDYSSATDFTDNDNNWSAPEFNNSKKDNAALDAHWGAMKTHDFFLEKFNRNSYDDSGTKLRSYVHYRINYVNAFWNGSVMTYGDGGGSIGPLTSIDICAHEIGHAVCSSTANLVYANEPGALNESLSDIWGATIEHYAAPEKSPWLLGEDINFVIRSMANPNEHNQPDTYLGNFWDPYQEVHANSGVMNHWYYILVEGKTGVDDNGLPYSVQGIGFESASKIVYRMETTYLTPNSQYADARVAAIQAAIDLFGNTSNEAQQTRKAWSAVGVYDIASSPSGLIATASSATSIALSWTDHATDEIGFIVERSLSFNTDFTQIATLGANVTSYTDSGLASNAIYYYRVSAAFSDHASSFSNVASAALGTPPLLMTNTTISTCNSVLLDPGGLSNYDNNQSIMMRINPGQPDKKVKVSFSSFSVSVNDYLYVYDGDANAQNLVGTFTGSSLPPDINALNSVGHLTFVFYSDNNNTSIGWQATLSCETMPTIPLNLTAVTATPTQINLTWEDASSNETGFTIERKSGSATSPFLTIATVPANSTAYSDQGLATNNTYSYRIKSLVGTSYSAYSNVATSTVGDPPLILQNGTYQTCSSVFLDPGGWDDYSNNQSYVMRVNPSEAGKKMKISFSSFNLESGYDYLTVYDGDNVSANLIGTYSGTSLPPDIVATKASGGLTFVFYSDQYVVRSGWQADLTCIILPNAPSNLVATAATTSQINLTWEDNEINETSVIVERKSGLSPNAQFSTVATLPANTTSFLDQGLPTNEKYYYRVRVSNGSDFSPYSNVADVTLGTVPFIMQSGTFQICGVNFLDPGGTGNYSGYQYLSTQIYPAESGKKVKVSFSSFALGQYDYLSIYDGGYLPENLLGTYNGTNTPPDINALNTSGYLTFVFYSSGYSQNAGWEATLTCVDVPNPPTNLVASATTDTQVNLTWIDNSTNETGFAIERKSMLPNSQFTTVATVGVNITSFSDIDLATNSRYYYRVKTLSGTSYSAYSGTVEVTLGNGPIIMNNGTISACNAQFFDSGYTNNYQNSENYTLTVNPSTAGEKLRVTFSSLSLESCCDALYIYDGSSTSSILIGSYSGSSLPPVITATNPQGSLTFRFQSDGSVTYAGWQATLTCVSVPNAPSNLTATAVSSTQINLTWVDNSSNETSFSIERRVESNPSSQFQNIATLPANTTTFSDQGLGTNEKYYYRARALASTANSLYSNISDATLGTPPLIMQSGVFQTCGITFLDPGGTGNYSNYQNITMRVNPSETGKKIKVVFSSLSLGSYDNLSIYDGAVTSQNFIGSYTGNTIPPEIMALNSTGGLTFIFYSSGYYSSAGWQATLTCVDIPNAPTNLTASAASGTEVNLVWQDNSTNETGFSIERKSTLSNSQFATVATVPANTIAYLDQGLPTNQRYFYRVKALNGTAFSEYSNTSDVEVGTAPVIMTNGTVTTCNAQFFDSGYANSYSNYESYTLTINPSTASGKLRITFTSLSLESGYDYLSIYDGPSTSSSLIGSYSGSSLPPVITATNPQGSLTFRFQSDGSVVYSGWVANLTCVAATPTITFNDINKSYGDNDFDLNATAYQGANFVYNVVADPTNTGQVNLSGSGNKSVSILRSGTIRLRAFLPASNGYPDAEKIATLTIMKGLPSIVFNDLTMNYDSQLDLAATAYEGASISYGVANDPSNTAQVTLNGVNNKTVTPIQAGTIKIKASLLETVNYYAAEKVMTLIVNKATPTITFANIIKTFGDMPFDLNATAYSGANFSYSIVNDPTNTAQVNLSGANNKTVTPIQAGTIKIKASVLETVNYYAAEKVMTLTVNKATPTITFTNIIKTFGDIPFDLNATAYSGANFSYSIVNDPTNTAQVTLSGANSKIVAISKAGIVKVKASLIETENYYSSERVATLTIEKSNQLVNIEPITTKLNTNEPFTISAASSSGLPVIISVKSGPANISGNILTLTKELGEVVIEAKHTGNENYWPSNVASVSFNVKIDPVLGIEVLDHDIQIWPIPTKRFLNVKSGSAKLLEISLTDLFGKEAASFKPNSNEIQIDLENFSHGLYLLKVSTGDKNLIKRIMLLD